MLTKFNELQTNVVFLLSGQDTLGGNQNLLGGRREGHARLCLCIILGVGDIWGGSKGMGECVSCVQVLTGNMTDGIVKSH